MTDAKFTIDPEFRKMVNSGEPVRFGPNGVRGLADLVGAYDELERELAEDTGVINALRHQRDKAEEERRFYQEMFKDTTEHMAAVHAALGLSYEAETSEVVAAIKRLQEIP